MRKKRLGYLVLHGSAWALLFFVLLFAVLSGAFGLKIQSTIKDNLIAQEALVREVSGLTGRFYLMNTDGEMVSDFAYRGKFTLVAFGYTTCIEMCPSPLQPMARVLDLLGADATQIRPLFVSLDPERDTKEKIKAYTASFRKDIIGLTGTLEQVEASAASFRVSFVKKMAQGTDGYDIDYSSDIFLMDPSGHYMAAYSDRMDPADMEVQIKKKIRAFEKEELRKNLKLPKAEAVRESKGDHK